MNKAFTFSDLNVTFCHSLCPEFVWSVKWGSTAFKINSQYVLEPNLWCVDTGEMGWGGHLEYKVLYTTQPNERCPFTERQLFLNQRFWQASEGSPVNSVGLRCVVHRHTHATVATTPTVTYAGILTPLSFDEYIKRQRMASKIPGHIDLCPHQDILRGINCLTEEAVIYSYSRLYEAYWLCLSAVLYHVGFYLLENINTHSEYAHFEGALKSTIKLGILQETD